MKGRILWGKRDGERRQTLYGHIWDSLAVAEALTRRPGFAGFCRRHHLDPSHFRRIVGLVVLFHDAGKGTRPFQEALEAGRTAWNFPHALAALPLMEKAWRAGPFPSLWGGAPILELLAVVAHHTELHRDLYQNLPEPHRPLGFLPEIDGILRHLYEELAPIWGWPNTFPALPLEGLNQLTLGKLSEDLLRIREVVARQVAGMTLEEQARLRARYTALLAYLKAADKAASRVFAERAGSGENGPLLPCPLPEPEIEALFPDWPSDAEERLRRTLPPGGDWFDYQTALQRDPPRWGLVRAPCGRGKTEAALLWFLRRRREDGLDRLIWTLPTQVTSNAMRERLAQVFGENRVGLYHGRSSLEHRERIRARLQSSKPATPIPLDPDPALELEWAREANFWSEVFAYPIVVTTADHLLYAFVHGFPQADFALGMLQGAAVVFDEVHAYDDQMQAELREAMGLLRAMGIPHLVMSATLPDPLVRVSRLMGYPLVEDSPGMERQPFRVLKQQKSMFRNEGDKLLVDDDVINEVVNGYRRGLVQFLIVNTVRKAQVLYRQLREFLPPEDCMCLHSRFAYAHRRSKERRVLERLKGSKTRKPFVLVATQVIEVSLDISADRMFSEIAPLDALAQRGGRVNRGGDQPEGILLVYPVDEHRPYAPDRISRSWAALGEGPVSYKDLHRWTNEVYADLEGGIARLPELFRECTLFGPDPSEIRFDEEHGRRYQPRRIEQPTIDVIPHELWTQLGPGRSPLEFLTPVPLWWLPYSQQNALQWFYLAEHPSSRRVWLICRRPYDEEIGFDEADLEPPSGGVIVD